MRWIANKIQITGFGEAGFGETGFGEGGFGKTGFSEARVNPVECIIGPFYVLLVLMFVTSLLAKRFILYKCWRYRAVFVSLMVRLVISTLVSLTWYCGPIWQLKVDFSKCDVMRIGTISSLGVFDFDCEVVPRVVSTTELKLCLVRTRICLR